MKPSWPAIIVLAVIVTFGVLALGDGGCRPGLFNLDFRPVRHKTVNIYLIRWIGKHHSGRPRRQFIKATSVEQARELAAERHGREWLDEENTMIEQVDRNLPSGAVGVVYSDHVMP